MAASVTALSAGGIALLERQLWQPDKTIMLPPPGGWPTKYGRFQLFEGGANMRLIAEYNAGKGDDIDRWLNEYARTHTLPSRRVLAVNGREEWMTYGREWG